MKGTYSVTSKYEVQGLGVGAKNKAGGVGRGNIMEGPTNLVKIFSFYPDSYGTLEKI